MADTFILSQKKHGLTHGTISSTIAKLKDHRETAYEPAPTNQVHLFQKKTKNQIACKEKHIFLNTTQSTIGGFLTILP